jgi:hypothetical protein
MNFVVCNVFICFTFWGAAVWGAPVWEQHPQMEDVVPVPLPALIWGGGGDALISLYLFDLFYTGDIVALHPHAAITQ